jgi:hypothetical protein
MKLINIWVVRRIMPTAMAARYAAALRFRGRYCVYTVHVDDPRLATIEFAMATAS